MPTGVYERTKKHKINISEALKEYWVNKTLISFKNIEHVNFI